MHDTLLSLPPRIVIDAVCLRLPDGSYLAHSRALPGRYELGATGEAAAERLRRYAETCVGEPVRVLFTSLALEPTAELPTRTAHVA